VRVSLRDGPRRAWTWLLAPVLLAGLVAAVSAYHLLPHGSLDVDELVYLNQAEALRHGQLTFDATEYTPDFRPYMTGVAGDRVVFKYQPLWPAWLALSVGSTGDHRPGLVVAAMAAALAFWLLARELTEDRRLATAAAVGVVVSPIFVTHSATALAYLPSAALAATALAAALRAVRLGGARWWVVAGTTLGALAFHRPFDAVLVGLPLLLLVAAPASRRATLLVAVAAAPWLILAGAYNHAATGSVVTPAFTVDAPHDTFGFGPRASFEPAGRPVVLPTEDPEPHDETVDYTPGEAARTTGKFALITPLWIAGGVVTLGLAAYAVVIGWADRRRRVLAGVVAAIVVGHFFWWGTSNLLMFLLQTSLGPAYWLAALGPTAALAAAGGRDLVRRVPRRRVLTLVGAGLVVSLVGDWAVAAVRIGDARESRDEQRAEWEAGAATVPRMSLTLVPGPLGNPFVHTVVPADLDAAPRLRAIDLATARQVFRLRDRFPDRSLWAWLPVRPPGTGLEAPRTQELTELPDLATAEVTVHVDVPGATTQWTRLLDDGGHELRRFSTAHLTAEDLRRVPKSAESPGWLAAGAMVRHRDGRRDNVEVRWMLRLKGHRIEIVGPGRGFRRFDYGGRHWLAEDVDDVLVARVEGLSEPRILARQALAHDSR